MLTTALALLTRRRPGAAPADRPAPPALTRQDLQALLREELDRLGPLSC